VLEELAKYRQVITLADGARVLFRPLTGEDKAALLALFVPVSDEDLRLMHDNVRDRELVTGWVEHLDYGKILPIVAVVNNRIVGDATLRFHVGPARHIGDVRIFIARDFRRRGLGTAMLRSIIDLARKSGLQQVVAEVLANQVKTVNAFKQLGFELRATYPDYFMTPDGETHDVNVLFLSLAPKKEEF
jgi:RimJ/RimL family protein N-acetyltransferase